MYRNYTTWVWINNKGNKFIRKYCKHNSKRHVDYSIESFWGDKTAYKIVVWRHDARRSVLYSADKTLGDTVGKWHKPNSCFKKMKDDLIKIEVVEEDTELKSISKINCQSDRS